jgi:hypothetical protein
MVIHSYATIQLWKDILCQVRARRLLLEAFVGAQTAKRSFRGAAIAARKAARSHCHRTSTRGAGRRP